MPRKLLRPCNYPGCSVLTEQGYCDKHKHSYNRARQGRRETSFYSSRDWRTTSLQYRAAHPTCEGCKAKPSEIVHHDPELQVLIRDGLDPLDWQYLTALCWSCHEKTKR